MTAKKHKPGRVRALNSLCAFVLLGTIIYIAIAGIDAIAVGVLALSVASVAAPVMVSSGGFLDVLSGVFEALIDGIVFIVEAVVDAIVGLFG